MFGVIVFNWVYKLRIIAVWFIIIIDYFYVLVNVFALCMKQNEFGFTYINRHFICPELSQYLFQFTVYIEISSFRLLLLAVHAVSSANLNFKRDEAVYRSFI
jgi:hypothetical protein